MLMFFFYILSAITTYDSLPSDIKSKLEAEFSNHKKVEFEIVKSFKNVKSIKYRKSEDISVIGSIAYVPVEVIDQRGKTKRTTLSVRAKIYEDVFVAVNDVKKRDPLQAIDFQLVEKEVSSLRGEIVVSLGEIIGKRADRFIKKGDILTIESLEKMPVIFSGNKINAVSIIGNVQISLVAFAKQEGSIGDVIRIRTKENKIYRAEVIDYKNVLIIEWIVLQALNNIVITNPVLWDEALKESLWDNLQKITSSSKKQTSRYDLERIKKWRR